MKFPVFSALVSTATLFGKSVNFPSLRNLSCLTRLMNDSFITRSSQSPDNVQLAQLFFIDGPQILAEELSQIPW